MTSLLASHPAPALLNAFYTAPALRKSCRRRVNLFGTPILRESDLSVVHADTNQAGDKIGGSPLWHGETWCIKQFFEISREDRPEAKECLFLTTHEPCSLCPSAITWAGFDNFAYTFTYEYTEKLFDGKDLDVLEHVFHRKDGGRAQQASKDGTLSPVRPEYKLRNKYFVALNFAELVAAVDNPAERDQWASKVEEAKRSSVKCIEGTEEDYSILASLEARPECHAE